eukprot:gene44716-28842_t
MPSPPRCPDRRRLVAFGTATAAALIATPGWLPALLLLQKGDGEQLEEGERRVDSDGANLTRRQFLFYNTEEWDNAPAAGSGAVPLPAPLRRWAAGAPAGGAACNASMPACLLARPLWWLPPAVREVAALLLRDARCFGCAPAGERRVDPGDMDARTFGEFASRYGGDGGRALWAAAAPVRGAGECCSGAGACVAGVCACRPVGGVRDDRPALDDAFCSGGKGMTGAPPSSTPPGRSGIDCAHGGSAPARRRGVAVYPPPAPLWAGVCARGSAGHLLESPRTLSPQTSVQVLGSAGAGLPFCDRGVGLDARAADYGADRGD